MSNHTALKTLTLAALALPGIGFNSDVLADEEEGGFTYGYYQEGRRNLYGLANNIQPIRVDTINTSGKINSDPFNQFSFNYIQDSWSGATPITTAPRGMMIDGLSGASSHVNTGKSLLVNKNFQPLKREYPDGVHLAYLQPANGNQLVDMLTAASPETRQQADVKYTHKWSDSALNFGGGISSEPDYQSFSLNSDLKKEFNHKLTTFNLGFGFTDSEVKALKMSSAQGYIDYGAYSFQKQINGTRDDWTAQIGMSHILNKFSFFSSELSVIRSHGYLSNPYKASTFIFKDSNQAHIFYPEGVYSAELISLLEKRPEQRQQFAWNAKYVHFIEPLDAALHFNYALSDDDWGILSHVFAFSWDQPIGDAWTLTPNLRYYTQDAADFYQPVFYVNTAKPVQGNKVDLTKLPYAHFSSDHRLSGFGALSGGINISRQFSKGVSFKAGFEYYTHQGGLKLGGNGENNYADFDYYLISAGLKINLAALTSAAFDSNHDVHRHHHDMPHNPAGVMFDHMLHNVDEWMWGYRYMYSEQSGAMRNGTQTLADNQLANQACPNNTCSLRPAYMHMHMHMLDLMYAPTDWFNIMLMPQFIDMNMTQISLPGMDDEYHKHQTSGVGDTGFYTLFKLYRDDNHTIHTTLGITAPTGKFNYRINPGHHVNTSPGYLHYGMQIGSGTWDLKPSITYNGLYQSWFWGGQASGTIRMQDQNTSGYALGNEAQISMWSGYTVNKWLSGTLRGIYNHQKNINGEFNDSHPETSSVDYASNYGGNFLDIGLGLDVAIPEKMGALSGHHIAFEWIQPIVSNFNGYQLDRFGALAATWKISF